MRGTKEVRLFKYMRYLFFYISRKKVTFILPLFLVVSFDIIIFFLIKNQNDSQQALIGDFLTALGTIITFFFLGLFLSLIIIYVFKDTEKNGTDLLVLAKSMTRSKVIIGKFCAVYTLLILYCVFVTTDFCLIGLSDKVAIMKDVLSPWIFGFSLGLGTLITGFFLIPIFIISVAFFSRVGTISVAFVLCACMPLLSLFLAPFSGYYGKFENEIKSYKTSFEDIEDEFNKLSTQKLDDSEMYLENYDFSGNQGGESFFNVNKDNFEHYKESIWYDQIVYLDFWYQWSTFFNLLYLNDQNQLHGYNGEYEEGFNGYGWDRYEYQTWIIHGPKTLTKSETKIETDDPKQIITGLDNVSYVLYMNESVNNITWEIDQLLNFNNHLYSLKTIDDEYEEQDFGDLQIEVVAPDEKEPEEDIDCYYDNLKTAFQNLENYLQTLKGNYSITEVAAALEYIVKNFQVIENTRGDEEFDDFFRAEEEFLEINQGESTWIENDVSEVAWYNINFFSNEQSWSKSTQNAPTSVGYVLYATLIVDSNSFFVENEVLAIKEDPSDFGSLQIQILSPSYVIKQNASAEYHNNVEKYLYEVGEEATTLEEADFISTWLITLIWLVTSVLLLTLAFTTYYKRDFK